MRTDLTESAARASEAEEPVAGPRRPLNELADRIGYQFSDQELMERAMVHKSFLHALPTSPLRSNERLEFLGDAVLGLITSAHLFSAHPDVPEGQLSALRAALVRLTTLTTIATHFELGEYLYLSRGEDAAGGRDRAGNLGRAVEALLGAVYLDGGLVAAERVWSKLSAQIDTADLREVLSTDHKSRLQQEAQALFREPPRYRIVGESGPPHEREFHVEVLVQGVPVGEGTGSNRQRAEQAAAKHALDEMTSWVGALSQGVNELATS